MRASAGKRLLALPERGKRLRAMPYGDTSLACRSELGVSLGNGTRDNDRVKIIREICSIVPDHDLDTRIHQTLGGTRLFHVRAAHLHATRLGDERYARHANTTDADEVYLLHIIQQMLGVVGVHEHSKETSYK